MSPIKDRFNGNFFHFLPFRVKLKRPYWACCGPLRSSTVDRRTARLDLDQKKQRTHHMAGVAGVGCIGIHMDES